LKSEKVRTVNDGPLSEEAIREELKRLLESAIFAQSDRLARFLRFTVEQVLEGKQDALKEYAIGTEVYDRKPPYHPSRDSIVRSEARRLRAKLKEYYEGEGKHAPVFIYFRLGSYVPVFRSREMLEREEKTSEDSNGGSEASPAGAAIAVIPFAAPSGNEFASAVAQGITDELVHRLMRAEGCRVIAASSMMHLGAQTADIPVLVEKLGVQIIFEGTVRLESNRIRVTARMVGADGFQMWSQQFEAEAEPERLFRVQEQIASAMVSRVAPRCPITRLIPSSMDPVNLKRYPAILAAEALLEEGGVADVEGALKRFETIAIADPEYARPYCGIAQCYYWMAQRGAPDSANLVATAKEAAERAMTLEPSMIEAHTAYACALAMDWQWTEAEGEFERALTLGSHQGTYRQYSTFLSALGRFDEAWSYLQIAQQLDPFSYRQKVSYARFLYVSRLYEDALEHFARPSSYGPLPLEVSALQALIEVQLGRHTEAMKLAQTLQRNVGGQPFFRSLIAEIVARCGEIEVAVKMIDDRRLFAPETQLSNFRRASLAVAIGDQGRAERYLRQAFEEREAELPWAAVEPGFDEMRENEEFRSIVESVVVKSTPKAVRV
jgi:TolB-like protein/Tfp pilus assembly protein PilF